MVAMMLMTKVSGVAQDFVKKLLVVKPTVKAGVLGVVQQKSFGGNIQDCK